MLLGLLTDDTHRRKPGSQTLPLREDLRSEERRVNQKNEMGSRSHPFQAGVDTNVVLTVQGEECQAKE